MTGALAFFCLRGVQGSSEALRALAAYRQFVVIALTGAKKPSDRALIAAGPLAKALGSHRIVSSYTLLVSKDGTGTLISDEIVAFKEAMDLPAVFRQLSRLPEGRVASLGSLPPAAVDYVRTSVARRLPYHRVPEGTAFGRTNYVLQPQNRVTRESNGKRVTLTMTDMGLARMTREERQEIYAPADATALPLALTPDQIGAQIQAQTASSSFLGEAMAFQVLRKRDPKASPDEAVQEAFDAYKEAIRKAREEADQAAEPLRKELAKRYPEMVGPYAKGAEVSGLPPEAREALRAMLQTQKDLDGSSLDIDAFLASARISDVSIGFVIGVPFQPNKDLIGVAFPPS